MKESKRVVIYPKDIVRLTDKSESYARSIIREIKKLHNKEKHQFVTIQEFCDFKGLRIEEVERKLIP